MLLLAISCGTARADRAVVLREPVVTPEGRIEWRALAGDEVPTAALLARALSRAAQGADSGGGAVGASRAALELLTPYRPLATWARLRLGMLAASGGDSVRADSLFASIPEGDPWGARARFGRSDLAIARGDTSLALSVLGDDRPEWLPVERAHRRLRLARLLPAIGDTAAALEVCRTGMRLDATTDSVLVFVALFEELHRAGHTRPSGEDELAMASAITWRDRSRQERHLVRAVSLLPDGPERVAASLDLATVRRLLRRYSDARRALARYRDAPLDSVERANRLLELARIERSASRRSDASHLALLAERAAPAGHALREEARMTRARWAEESGAAAQALHDYEAAWRMGGRRAAEAAFHAGFVSWLQGDAQTAERWWGRTGEEASHFWRALGMRARGARTAGDSLLAMLAQRPGFGFYRSAARETLGIAPPLTPVARAGRGNPPLLIGLAEDLAALGERDDAGYVIERYLVRESTSPRHGLWPLARNRIRAARLAYAVERHALGIRLAHRALWAERSSDEVRQSIRPWLYPPSYGALFAERASAEGLDDALLRAIAWQESFFDAPAVSRAGAVGVMQFIPATAATVARSLGIRPPSVEDLQDPDLNVSLGARHVADLIRRYDGRVPPALAAYNAGPGAAGRWLRRVDDASDAAYCEVVAYPETDRYVRSVLGVWQAYRTYRPHETEAAGDGAAADGATGR